jgi:hypothetical protein
MVRLIAIAFAASLTLAGHAQAGCDPKCSSGQTCRYDSTWDPEFQCRSTGGKGLKTDLKRPLQIQGATPDLNGGGKPVN